MTTPYCLHAVACQMQIMTVPSNLYVAQVYSEINPKKLDVAVVMYNKVVSQYQISVRNNMTNVTKITIHVQNITFIKLHVILNINSEFDAANITKIVNLLHSIKS